MNNKILIDIFLLLGIMQHEPYIYKLSTNSIDSIGKEDKNDLIMSSTINQPLMSLGYHYYMHKLRTELITFTKSIKSEQQFYFVVNPFEVNISNYNEGINYLAQIYLNLEKNKTFGRSFYKMWEILFSFDIGSENSFQHIDINDSSKLAVDINDVVLLFRKKFNYASKMDKTNTIDINDKKLSLDKASLITCNLKVNINNDMYITQEQSSYGLLLKAVFSALKMQNNKGNFVLRIFETFTKVSIKIIYLLSCFYEEVLIYKPYFSRGTSSEKYLICKKFKYDQTKDSKLLEKYYKRFDNILEKIKADKHILDIFSELELNDEYCNSFKFMNIRLVNNQQIMINKIITYIKENNYYGDKYHTYRDIEIKSIEWWSRLFFPPSNNIYESNKKEILKLNDTTQNKHKLEINMFAESLL
jgi:23S rRNA U2552 (ribose-2'-O)-methylase RlmE/FtsJ